MKTYINKKTIIIVCSTLVSILLLWLAGFGFGNEIKLSELLGMKFLGNALYLGTWFIYIAITIIGLGIPFLIIRFVFKEKLQDYGFCLGDAKSGLIWILALIPLYIFGPLFSAHTGTEKYYTFLADPNWLKPLHVAIHCTSFVLFAFSFEFLFRGFVLFGLNKNMGNTKTSKWIAMFLSGILAALCLIGQPRMFIISAFVSSIIGGLLNFKLRSFIYLAFIHWNLGIWSDIWEIIKLNITNGSIW